MDSQILTTLYIYTEGDNVVSPFQSYNIQRSRFSLRLVIQFFLVFLFFFLIDDS
jgi:hypothetical protein